MDKWDGVEHCTVFLNDLCQFDARFKVLLTVITYHASTGNMFSNLTTWGGGRGVALMNCDTFGLATSPFLNDVTGKTPHVAGPSARLADVCRKQSDGSCSRRFRFHI
ncbi:hypothetical protein EV715DRAFT_297964 [Schizophyllum commune]